jgi:hypothetical protein
LDYWGFDLNSEILDLFFKYCVPTKNVLKNINFETIRNKICELSNSSISNLSDDEIKESAIRNGFKFNLNGYFNISKSESIPFIDKVVRMKWFCNYLDYFFFFEEKKETLMILHNYILFDIKKNSRFYKNDKIKKRINPEYDETKIREMRRRNIDKYLTEKIGEFDTVDLPFYDLYIDLSFLPVEDGFDSKFIFFNNSNNNASLKFSLIGEHHSPYTEINRLCKYNQLSKDYQNMLKVIVGIYPDIDLYIEEKILKEI